MLAIWGVVSRWWGSKRAGNFNRDYFLKRKFLAAENITFHR